MAVMAVAVGHTLDELIFYGQDGARNVGWEALVLRPLLQQTLLELVNVEPPPPPLLLRPQLPERPLAEREKKIGRLLQRRLLLAAAELDFPQLVNPQRRVRRVRPVRAEPLETAVPIGGGRRVRDVEDLAQRVEVSPGDGTAVVVVELVKHLADVLVQTDSIAARRPAEVVAQSLLEQSPDLAAATPAVTPEDDILLLLSDGCHQRDDAAVAAADVLGAALMAAGRLDLGRRLRPAAAGGGGGTGSDG